MKAAFHYVVRAKIIKRVVDNQFEFLEFEESFENASPILAREKAFVFYQNYIDVLLEANNKSYKSDRQAREELGSFIDSKFHGIPGLKLGYEDIDEAANLGLGVFMVIDNPIPQPSFKIKGEIFHIIDKEIFVHGVGAINYLGFRPEELILDLEKELNYYIHYKYPHKNYEKKVTFFSKYEWEEGYGDSEPNEYKILWTPFDWEGFEKPFWWGENKPKEEQKYGKQQKSIEKIISGGENNQVEFKPTLLFNFLTKKPGIGVKAIIAKAICAFLNSNGGFLFIGIKDDGSIQGLDFDFKLSESKDPKDFFLLEFDQMIEHFLSFVVKGYINTEFVELNGKQIFVVRVHPSKRKPVFLKGQNGKEFYVRGEASSRQLVDVEDIVNYCLNKWNE